MALTVKNLIETALRLCGVMLAPGRGASQEQQAEGLAVLNSLVDSWATERLMVYSTPRTLFDLQAGKAEYTIGPNGDFDTVRPPRIERAGLVWLANPTDPEEITLRVCRNVGEWQAIALKATTSTMPDTLWYDPAHPQGIIHLSPVPTVASQLALYPWTLIGQFATVNDDVSLPYGYQRALEYNLAVELAARNPARQVSPLVFQMAVDSKAKIKALNIQPIILRCDSALFGGGNGGRFDVLTGDYR